MQYEVVISATLVYTTMACSTQYGVVTSPSRAVQMHWNGDDGSALIFVGCNGCRVGRLWTNSTYVCGIAACALALLGDAYWWSMQFEVVISPSYVYTALIFIRSMNVWNGYCVGPGRTARTFILLEFDTCYWWSMQYEVAISLSRAVQIHYVQ